MWVSCLSSSPDRWLVEPLPAEAKVMLSSFLRSSSISSWTLRAGILLLTTSTLTKRPASPIGVKSLSGL
ncbi:Uncharacterised protein [Bordetella pertussis]|nr:Uncharacterised protein [Bordetella pertussis]